MNRRRTRDRGHFKTNIELMVFIVIVGILAAIAVPPVIKMMDARAPKCLDLLARAAGGPLPQDSVCPKSGKPYAPTAETVSCPTPDQHLDSKPRFVRVKDGPWTLQQTLPVAGGKPLELGHGRTVVVAGPGRVSLHALPSKAVRWFVGPLFLAVTALLAIGCLVFVASALRSKERGSLAPPAVLAVIFGVLSWILLGGIASSSEFIVEPGRVTRVDYRMGKASATLYEGCLGLVPATPTTGKHSKVFLVHAPDADGNRVTPIDVVPTDRLDVVSSLNRILTGP